MFTVHQELTGLMYHQLEEKLPIPHVNKLVLTFYFEQTSTNPLWNYTSTIQPVIL